MMPPNEDQKLYTKEEVQAILEEEKKVIAAQHRFENLEKTLGEHSVQLKNHEDRITSREADDAGIKKQVKEIHEKLVVVDAKPKKFWQTWKEVIQNISGTLSLIVLITAIFGGFFLWASKQPQTVTSPTVMTK